MSPPQADRNPALSPKAQRIIATLKAAVAHHRSGEFTAAEVLYKKVRATDPRNFVALQLSGALAAQTGDFELALNFLSRALALKPDYVDALNNRGNVYNELWRLDEALQDYSLVLTLKPDNADTLNNRGTILEKLRRLDEALADYDKAIALQPDFVSAFHNRGNALQALERYDEALEAYERALQLKPDYAEAFHNRGNVLQKVDRLEEALREYRSAIELKPTYVEALNNCGNVLERLGRRDEALRLYRDTLAIEAEGASALYNRARVLEQFHRFDEAVENYDKAISLQPTSIFARWNKSLVLLRQGDFKNGWDLYEWRWKLEDGRGFSKPLWLGKESLRGKTVLLHAEQGLGDTIQFCRFVKQVKALECKVILEVQKPLLGLLDQLDCVDELIAYRAALPDFDLHCPLMSLPLALGTTLETIPQATPYLKAKKDQVKSWSERLGRASVPRVGIVWSGSRSHVNDYNRSISLDLFLTAIPENCAVFSLQKEVRDGDLDILRQFPRIAHFGEDLVDFSDTAALCDLMDVVLSVDTSVAHLAGALGKTTYMLLPYMSDFRWLQGRQDCPWYDAMRLFRQGPDRDWSPILESMRKTLSADFA